MFKVGDMVDWYPMGFDKDKSDTWSGSIVERLPEVYGEVLLEVTSRNGALGWLSASQCKLTKGQHKTWGEMTPEEKGALLLAHHEGKDIQCFDLCSKNWFTLPKPTWYNIYCYRVKPEPKVETVVMYGCGNELGWGFGTTLTKTDTHKITFDVVDGVPDCGSIKMEKL